MRAKHWINQLMLSGLYLGLLAESLLASPSRDIAGSIKNVIIRVQSPEYSQIGVIIAQEANKNWLLTCSSNQIEENNDLEIITNDKATHTIIDRENLTIDSRSVELISFESRNPYAKAMLGASKVLQEGESIYATGLIPLEKESSFWFTSGFISSISRYGFIHTSPIVIEENNAIIFDHQGELIGIQCSANSNPSLAKRETEAYWVIEIHNIVEIAYREGFSFGFSSYGIPPAPSNLPPAY